MRTLDTETFKHMTAVPKNVYIHMLDEIVNKYKKKYHRIIKLKPADVKMDTYIDYDVDHNGKDLDSKLEIILEYQNAKIIFNISPN